MGTCFELLDRTNQRRFDLDKLYLRGLDDEKPLTLAEVRAEYARAWEARYHEKLDFVDEDNNVKRVWAFCEVARWNIEMHSESSEYADDAMALWPVVDGRCRGLYPDGFDTDPCAEQTARLLRTGG